MALTLAGVRTRVRNLLVDNGSLIWQDAVLDEGIRRGLEELSRVYGAALTLNGLDSATQTTLAERDGGTLCAGAAGFAALSRAVDRTEIDARQGGTVQELLAWGEGQVQRFNEALEQVRRRLQQDAAGNSWVQWALEPPTNFSGED
jgi:hypothetical protein